MLERVPATRRDGLIEAMRHIEALRGGREPRGCPFLLRQERPGENPGPIPLVRKWQTVARLRLLLVEPSGRGPGIGGALVSECRFARGAGYKKLTLWTQSEPRAARTAGFGRDVVAETWDMRL